MDNHDVHPNSVHQKLNKLSQIDQNSSGSGRVAPPIPTTNAYIPPLNTNSTAIASSAHNMLARGNRRIPSMPMHYMPSSAGAAYGGGYNNYSYRPYMNLGGYNPYSSYGSYGQPMTNQYQNPVVIAAAENSRPAFESIHSVVQSFNAVSMMLESTFTAMQMSFQALLGVAENFTRLRMFMMKLYSTIVTFKLARWFFTKLFYLLKLVRGSKVSSAEEELWSTLSSTTPVEVPSDARSWPLVVFTGLLVATPYFVYKLLNSVTPTSSSLPLNSSLTPPRVPAPKMEKKYIFKAPCGWNCGDPQTIPLLKGNIYSTTSSRIAKCAQNGGWLLIDNSNGQKGYVPFELLKLPRAEITNNGQPLSVVPEMSSPDQI